MNKMHAFYMVLHQRFHSLPQNDRRALVIMFAALGFTILYFSLSISRDYQQAAITHYQDMSKDSRWIELNAAQIRSLVSATAKKPAGGAEPGASLINQATTSAKPFGVAFKRFQPEGDTGLRLWIEGAEFDQLMRWLAALESQHIQLDQLEVDKQEKQPGIVQARVLLSQNP